jgi:hypothetical protein
VRGVAEAGDDPVFGTRSGRTGGRIGRFVEGLEAGADEEEEKNGRGENFHDAPSGDCDARLAEMEGRASTKLKIVTRRRGGLGSGLHLKA